MTHDAPRGAPLADSPRPPAPSTEPESPARDELRDRIRTHMPALRNFALSLTRDAAQADDLVQETLLRAWRNAERYEPGSNLQSWLFTILHHAFVSDLRRQRRRERLERVEIDPITPPAHDGKLALRDFLRAFDTVSPKHRDLIVLVGMLGLSYEEAAALLGLSVGTAKSRVSRARKQLLAWIDPGRGGASTDPDQPA